MNPQLTIDLASGTARDFQHLADQRRAHSDHLEPSVVSSRRPSPLRATIGFTLVEAGLALIAGADRGYLPS